MPPPKLIDGLGQVIASAAASVGATLLLFNGFIQELVPPIDGAKLTIGIVSFATMVALLALTLLIRSRLSALRQQVMAAVSLLLVAAAVAAFFMYHDYVREYVIWYPPSATVTDESVRIIRGPLHEEGMQRAQGMSMAAAIQQFGGPDLVMRRSLLWTEAARNHVISRLETAYVGLAMLLTLSIYIVALTVLRASGAKKG
jgi:hypothetical protein